MSEKWFEDLKTEVRAFFETATEAEINQALEEAGYDFYKDIDVPIFEFHAASIIYEWKGTAIGKASFKLSARMMIKNESISLEEMVLSADNYGYAMAA